MHKQRWCCVLLALVAMAAQAEDNPLVDLLNRRKYDREAILRHTPPDAPVVNNQKAQQPPAAFEKPIFLPPQMPSVIKNARPSLLALVLPTNAGGLTGRAADSFYRGCLHGVRESGQLAEIDLYATDGTAASAYDNYAAAVHNMTQFIIGPMLKSSVRELLNKQPQASVPTLLLQPGKGYYVMTLDAAQEAADLARLLYARGVTEVHVIEQQGRRGARQREAFEQEWIALSGRTSGRFWVRDPPRDWQRLFNDLKTRADDDEILVFFAAGDGNFARKTRKFVPQQYPVYAASIFSNDKKVGFSLSEDLRFMEMPWFLGLSDEHAIYDAPKMRTLPVIRQRFFALGVDACLTALDWPLWEEGWTVSGVSGDWRLQNGVFSRAGTLVFSRAGQLRILEP